MTKTAIIKYLKKYIPVEVLDYVVPILVEHNITLTNITHKNNLGCFIVDNILEKPEYIQIHSGLNKYAYTITLLHEIAHLLVYVNYKQMGHNKYWKNTYRALLIKVIIQSDIFPKDVVEAVGMSLDSIRGRSNILNPDLALLIKYDTPERSLLTQMLDQYNLGITDLEDVIKNNVDSVKIGEYFYLSDSSIRYKKISSKISNCVCEAEDGTLYNINKKYPIKIN